MLYNLQGGKNTNVLDVVAGEDLVRGQLVKIEYANGKRVAKKLVGTDEIVKLAGIVTRGVKVTDAVAFGVQESDIDVAQDVILEGEMCGIYPLLNGDVYASTCFDADVTAGTAVFGVDGNIVADGSATETSPLVSEGMLEVAGHKCVTFRVIK